MMDNLGIIASLVSLVISGILAYSYVQIRLSLAENILQVLNGRYMKRDMGDLQLKRLEEIHTQAAQANEKALAEIQRELRAIKEHGCDVFRHTGRHTHRMGEEE